MPPPLRQRRSRHAPLLAAYTALAGADSALAGSTHPRAETARRVTKPLLLPILMASQVAPPRTGVRRRSTLAAQMLSWVGDLALMSPREPAFLAGMAAFAGGHAAYIAGWRADGARPGRDAPSTRALAALTAVGAPAMALGAARHERALALPVGAYAVTLAAMAAHACVAPGSRSGRLLTVAGSLLFVASDATLGSRRFWLDSASPASQARAERTVMATYTAAQLLLSEGARHG